jgi:hypothetical protein
VKVRKAKLAVAEYAMCECPSPSFQCCGGRGPAAYEATRDGKRLKLCTRCDLSGDQDKRLIVTEQHSVKVLMDFDAIGAFVVMHELMEARKMATP